MHHNIQYIYIAVAVQDSNIAVLHVSKIKVSNSSGKM